MTPISDDALLAFALLCRLNEERFIRDRALMRRIFNAYAGLEDSDLASRGLRKRKRHTFRARRIRRRR